MAKAVYISPEYNPHSLTRDWGFFIEAQRPDIYAALSGSLATLRQTLVNATTAITTTGIAATGHVIAPGQIQGKGHEIKSPMPPPSRVTADFFDATAKTLYKEVGLDVLSLALLADVPGHRPLHLSHNSLIGHWRWLRLVWRTLSQTTPNPAQAQPIKTVRLSGAPHQTRAGNRNNIAIANLRQMFQALQGGSDPINLEQVPHDKLYSFLANLTLFCPFIGCELLCQNGLIKAPWTKGSLE